MYAYARRRGSAEDAQEAVAETFLVAWRRLGDVPSDAALPWLLNVARKVLANRHRALRRRVVFEDRLGSVSRRTPQADPADEVSTRVSVQVALEALPPAEREALTLVAWDGLTVTEAATAAGCSHNTFSVRLHRARRRLMKELGLRGHSSSQQMSTKVEEAR